MGAADESKQSSSDFQTDVFVARKFLELYQATKRIAAISAPELIPTVRSFELQVLNFLNLAEAEHFHAIRNFTFPRRQGGTAQPKAPQHRGVPALSVYLRHYRRGKVKMFSETCRFCRQDGEQAWHYGCWEEEALSFEKCVSNGGIYYDSSLPISNEFRCRQFASFEH